MARRDRRTSHEKRIDEARANIRWARHDLDGTVLGPLLGSVPVYECPDDPDWPLIAGVSLDNGVIFANPHRRPEILRAAWVHFIAHQCLHLALGHDKRCQDRDRYLWSVACDIYIDNLLAALKIGSPPHDFVCEPQFTGRTEEAIYEAVLADKRYSAKWLTPAGVGRTDMLYGGPDARDIGWGYRDRRTDYENLFAEGIRRAVDEAVVEASVHLGDTGAQAKLWAVARRARQWVMYEFPLLGALAADLSIIADGPMCDRMDIGVAAVNPYLGEIYLNKDRRLDQDEWVFVYVHELLHVALMHSSRLQGRDPEVWNWACDFVINGWLVEMGVGKLPSVGALFDPRLRGMSAEEVYDLLLRDPRKCKGLRGFRGGRGDIIWDARKPILRGEVATLDDMVRRCLAVGLTCPMRGFVPAGMLEEIRSLFAPPVPWDVELARWMEGHVPYVRESLRTYARASRRQASTPDIPRAARHVPLEWREACTFGVVLDTSGSMDRELLGRALGAIASFSEARDVPAIRLVMCDAQPYDRGFVSPIDLRGVFPVQGRGGTVLQPAVNLLASRPDFPPNAPVMILTDGWCEEEIVCPRDHCFVMPRKSGMDKYQTLRTSAPVFRILREDHWQDQDV